MAIPALLKIDELCRNDHSWLEPDDECYYFLEYTARKGFSFSEGNQFISNFKKSPQKRGLPEWYFKEQAILKAARYIKQNLPNISDGKALSLVPIPPSKTKDNPEYDNRVFQTLTLVSKENVADVLSIIADMEPAHLANRRPTVDELIDNLHINPQPALAPNVILFDDVLTTGCHYKACKDVILELYPNANVIGLFLARRVPENDIWDFDDL